MATVNNTSSTSKVAYSYLQYKNKIGGLVSGMDIDSIMEKLMKAESAQMEKLQQQKQKYEWTRDAYREVNTTLTSFQQGLFDDYGKNSNWNMKTANVSSSTAVSVVAGASANGNLSITGSKQAQSANGVTSATKNVQQIRITEDTKLSTISSIGSSSLKLFGEEITSDKTIKDVMTTLDSKGYTTKITDGRLNISPKTSATGFTDATEQQETLASLQKLGFNTTSAQQSDKLEVNGTTATTYTTLSSLGIASDGKMKLTVGGEDVEVSYSKDDTLKSLMTKINTATGLSASLTDGQIKLSSSSNKSIVVNDSPINFSEKTTGLSIKQKSEAIKIDDKPITTATKLSSLGITSDGSLTFNVNGETKTVNYTKDDDFSTVLSNITKETGLKASLDSGSIVLESDSTRPFSTTNTSPFIFNSGQTLGSASGETLYSSNTSNASTELKGTSTVAELLGTNSTDTNKFTLSAMKEDGTMKETTIEFKNTDTIDSIISKINSSGAGVTAIFNNGQLSISANNTGERKDGGAEVSLLADKSIGNGTALFNALGVADSTGEVTLADGGNDAQLTVNGVTHKQQSNVFNVAGYTITATGDLGSYNADGTLETPGSTVSVSSTTNTDDIIKKVKEFIETYNGLIKDLNTKVTQKRNVDYAPLTDAQKAEMSEAEITKWEEKAKAGLLKGNNNINSALSTMRSALSQYGSTTGDTLYSMGISTSSTWSDNGKLEIDEDKLLAALEKDPEVVSRIFSGDSTNGQEGIVSKLRTSAQTAVKNIEVTAGKATSTSEKSYSLGRTISDLDTKISDWKDRLKDIEERYWNQFSAMETAIQRANSQSSIFMQG